MEWEQTARNLERLEPAVAAADADVVVLPEMFATGFKLAPARVAEPADGPTVRAMRRWAREYGRAVAGSVAVAEGGTYRNRLFFVRPSGETTCYDKRHLFRPGGEGRDYTPGAQRAVAEYVFRSGAAVATTTTPSSTAPRGPKRGATPGGRCCGRGPSRTSVTCSA